MSSIGYLLILKPINFSIIIKDIILFIFIVQHNIDYNLQITWDHSFD